MLSENYLLSICQPQINDEQFCTAGLTGKIPKTIVILSVLSAQRSAGVFAMQLFPNLL